MKAAELLADLRGQGFCLDACDDGIAVDPASRLTNAQIQAIREQKEELLALLRAGAPATAEGTTRKKRRGKTQKRVAAKKPVVRPMAKSERPPAGDGKPEPRKRCVADAVQAEAPPAWTPTCPMCGLPPPGSPTCLRCKGLAELEAARRARSHTRTTSPNDGIPNVPLCSQCWSLGYASCAECQLAHDPTLQWDGYILCQVRAKTEVERSWSWRRCDVCYDPFQGPRFGIPNLCPTCRAGPAICSLCGGRDRAHLRECKRYVEGTTPQACNLCGRPAACGTRCNRCRGQ